MSRPRYRRGVVRRERGGARAQFLFITGSIVAALLASWGVYQYLIWWLA